MTAIVVSKDMYRKLNRWDNDHISPGVVHSVGDVQAGVRYAQSAPDLPMRFDPMFSGKNADRMGNNNADGGHRGYFNNGLGDPITKDSAWNGRRDFKTALGWIHQDLRPESGKQNIALTQSTPNATWDRRVGEVYKVTRPNHAFLPVPGGYHPLPGQLPRGGNVPEIVAIEGDPEASLHLDPMRISQLVGFASETTLNGMGMRTTGKPFINRSNLRYSQKR
jgi:hypothetical protein